MKTFHFLIFILFINLLDMSPLSAQWMRTNGPYGGFVETIMANDTSVYVGTYNGVFRLNGSHDGWIAANNGINDMITAIAISGKDIFAGTWVNGIYFSEDGGNSWETINNGLPRDFGTVSLVNSGGYLFLGTRFSGGIFRLSTADRRWIAVNKGLYDSLSVRTLSADSRYLFAGTDHGVFRTADNGAHWTAVKSGLPTDVDVDVNTIVFVDSVMYAGTGHGVFCSTDQGDSWTPENTGLPDHPNIFALAVEGNTLFAGTTSNGVYTFLPKEKKWLAVNGDVLQSTKITALAVSDSSLYAGTEGNGVYVSANGGKKWENLNDGLRAVSVYTLVSSGRNLIAGGNGLFLSENGGDNWAKVNGTFDIITMAGVDSALYAASMNYRVLRSFDQGKSWEFANSGLPDRSNLQSLAAADSIVFVKTWNGSFVSKDFANSWQETGVAGLPDSIWANTLAVCGNNLLISTSKGLFYSDDYGYNWKAAAGWPPYATALSFTVTGNKVYASLSDGYGVFRSDDNGQTWSNINPAKNQISGFICLYAYDTVLFASTIDGQVLFLTDNGNQWKSVGIGLPDDLAVFSMVVSGQNLYIATSADELWYSPLSSILTGVRSVQTINKSLQLKSFPNPFHAETSIEYRIPEAGRVRLVILNGLGQEVAVLVNQSQKAGKHLVKWNASSLPGGVYYSRLTLSGSRLFIQTNVMVLRK